MGKVLSGELSYPCDRSCLALKGGPTDFSSGPGCLKLSMSLDNVLLKFQMLISEIHQYFLLKKCKKL